MSLRRVVHFIVMLLFAWRRVSRRFVSFEAYAQSVSLRRVVHFIVMLLRLPAYLSGHKVRRLGPVGVAQAGRPLHRYAPLPRGSLIGSQDRES